MLFASAASVLLGGGGDGVCTRACARPPGCFVLLTLEVSSEIKTRECLLVANQVDVS